MTQQSISAQSFEQYKAQRNLYAGSTPAPALTLSRIDYRLAPQTGKVRTLRISIANDGSWTEYEIAQYLQCSLLLTPWSPLDVGISFGYGAGEWGVEKCVHIETATPRDVTGWIVTLLENFEQTCAYVVVGGSEAYECTLAGEWNRITGE